MVAEVEKNSKDTVCKYRDAMLQRLANSGLQLDVNDERVLKEISLFADKCDISEEITRLKSHISQFLSTMDENDAVGRKMDFICQEMGREINTIASKANNLELTKLAIELKNELERVRGANPERRIALAFRHNRNFLRRTRKEADALPTVRTLRQGRDGQNSKGLGHS